ncbi:SGNH/GDSL hydrolase family protein [Yinghuangia seranimata]|uniref:SGNH/GDSL hydrolase family protein n=1 Tax=Yinghuangia seranimata TaxID=408067 RepID=UPI00248C1D02|nr:SGNH/GDSL hydrolase family protein [Yinghuangia seranimata]MDI2129419.1 SGNH/GDSL hydrolase family protein [Yinghuangia seranimata]
MEPTANKAAARSAGNYPRLLARRLGARLTDLTVSGATTATVPEDADLVTITVGGNDLNYASAMFAAGFAGRLSTRRWTRPLRAVLPTATVPEPTEEDLDRAAAALVRVVIGARDRAPGARVLLVDYLTVLGPDTRPGPNVPLPQESLAKLRALGHQVDRLFALAAERTAAELVPISSLSRDHTLGSSEPWVTGFPPRLRDLRRIAPFHPNAHGMHAVADAIVRHLDTPRSAPGQL